VHQGYYNGAVLKLVGHPVAIPHVTRLSRVADLERSGSHSRPTILRVRRWFTLSPMSVAAIDESMVYQQFASLGVPPVGLAAGRFVLPNAKVLNVEVFATPRLRYTSFR